MRIKLGTSSTAMVVRGSSGQEILWEERSRTIRSDRRISRYEDVSMLAMKEGSEADVAASEPGIIFISVDRKSTR